MPQTTDAAKFAVDEAEFATFLQEKTSSVISASTIGSDWSGLQALEVKQGDEAFQSPPLQSHFVALCIDGFGVADISFDALSGPKRSVVEPGKLCFLPAGHSSSFEMAGKVLSLHTFIKPEVMAAVAEKRGAGDPSGTNLEGFVGHQHAAIQDTMLEIRAGAGRCDALWADTMAMRLAQQIVDFTWSPSAEDDTICDLSDLHFCRAIDYIEANLARDFGLDEIAEAVGVDALHLSQGFAEQAGCSIEGFRTERRVGIVQTWLRAKTNSLSIDELAARVGFAGAAALDAAFRSHLGITVANFRAGRFG